MARRMTQRHEYLKVTHAFLTNVALHYRVTTAVSMFLLNPLKDAFGSMALLSGFILVLLRDGINDTCEWIKLGFAMLVSFRKESIVQVAHFCSAVLRPLTGKLKIKPYNSYSVL